MLRKIWGGWKECLMEERGKVVQCESKSNLGYIITSAKQGNMTENTL